MPLDSDVPNADLNLQVEFYVFEGDGMWKGVPHVRITTPGDKTNRPDRPASDDDKRRFQREWLHFQARTSGDLVIGTPLLTWREERPDDLTDGQMQELMILKFLSVDQLAMASDTQVARVGMGAVGLRERARRYLAAKNAQASGAALERAQDELFMMKAAMERMQAQMLELKTAPPKEEVHRPGAARRKVAWNKGMKRPTTKKAPADVDHDHAAAGAASG